MYCATLLEIYMSYKRYAHLHNFSLGFYGWFSHAFPLHRSTFNMLTKTGKLFVNILATFIQHLPTLNAFCSNSAKCGWNFGSVSCHSLKITRGLGRFFRSSVDSCRILIRLFSATRRRMMRIYVCYAEVGANLRVASKRRRRRKRRTGRRAPAAAPPRARGRAHRSAKAAAPMMTMGPVKNWRPTDSVSRHQQKIWLWLLIIKNMKQLINLTEFFQNFCAKHCKPLFDILILIIYPTLHYHVH